MKKEEEEEEKHGEWVINIGKRPRRRKAQSLTENEKTNTRYAHAGKHSQPDNQSVIRPASQTVIQVDTI